jgi:transcriptional regulator with XRE-family HTH domain
MASHQWNENIKIYRKKLGLTQAALAIQLDTTPQTVSNWEKDLTWPDIEQVQQLSRIFGISLDAFFEHPHLIEKKLESKNNQVPHLNPHGYPHLNAHKEGNSGLLNEPKGVYKTNTIPAFITVNQHGIDNILYVPVKARAGYLTGYADREFIETLPAFQMPGLRNGTFRMFEVDGLSMSPTLSHNDKVIAEWVPNMAEIRENRVHVVVLKDGIVIKRVLNRVDIRGKIYLKSDTLTHRTDYPIQEIDPADIIEIWYVRLKVSGDLSEPAEIYNRLNDLEIFMHEAAKRLDMKH